MAKKKGLGRGLDSLISGGVKTPAKKAVVKKKPAKKNPTKKTSTPKKKAKPAKKTPAKHTQETVKTPETGLMEIPIHKVVPSPHQPRKHFEEESLKELAESIRSEGLLQPIVVRKVADNFELIAGERRWRACQSLKLKQIPAKIIETSEASSAILSLIENLQREDLNPIEESLGYASLMRDFNLTQEAISERVGKSRASVANSLRLLQLEKEIQSFVGRKLLSVGHAKVLLGVTEGETRLLIARQAIEKGWSVRELERQIESKPSASGGNTNSKNLSESELTAVRDIEKQIANRLNTKVQLKHTPKKGKIIIQYFGNDDLQRIMEKMGLE